MRRPSGPDSEVGAISRRVFLFSRAPLAFSWIGGAWLGWMGCRSDAPVCFDPELLSTPERVLRRTQAYVDSSPHPEDRRCAGCAFFEAGAKDDCGTCRILMGPVSAWGHCESWSRAKAEAAA